MAQTTTEIALLPLKPDVDLEQGDAKGIWQGMLKTIASQKGYQKLYWGVKVEDKETAVLVVVWDSLESHNAFSSSPAYQPFLENIKPILAGPAHIFHARFPAEYAEPNPLTAPVTECINAYFSASHSEAEYTANFAQFRSEGEKIPDIEAVGMTGAFSIEAHEHENLGEGEQGKLFAAFVGWPSVEAHLAFRKTEEFAKIIGLLRGGAKGLKVWHVAFREYA
ncbi:hypothetical protein IQ07DRAFT_278701 [Pyrenochaeta sp. DS3sAY3a]|nr:hypothetical protein IQ07DRAFT_278701 [Pyrenochaeta sp. DS3sAY3a]